MPECTRTAPGRFTPSLVAVLTVAAVLVISPSAYARWGVQLFTVNVGWQVVSGRLFWTNDGGAHWTDISPPIPQQVRGSHGEQEVQPLQSVFFLNTHVGWALYSHPDSPDARFKLAFTTDSGRNWTIWSLQLPPKNRWLSIAPGAQIAFANRLDGWMEAHPPHGSAFLPGVLLTTTDGGRTWKFAPSNPGTSNKPSFWGPGYPGAGGRILVRSPREVWLAGGVTLQDLYVSRDGAKSWQKISLPAPPGLYPARIPSYDLPIFTNEEDGYEAVTYATLDYGPGATRNGNYGRSAAVLFVTKDGGRTWKPDRIVTNLRPVSPGYPVPSTVVGDEWILVFNRPVNTAHPFQKTPPLLLKVGPGQSIKASADIASANFARPGLSFVTSAIGLLEEQFTDDGGVTWRRASPFPKLHFHAFILNPPADRGRQPDPRPTIRAGIPHNR